MCLPFLSLFPLLFADRVHVGQATSQGVFELQVFVSLLLNALLGVSILLPRALLRPFHLPQIDINVILDITFFSVSCKMERSFCSAVEKKGSISLFISDEHCLRSLET